MTDFDRVGSSELQITLSSNEPLGILDSAYIEDYFGTDGQISLYLAATGARFPVLMNALPDATPEMDNDVFTGYADLRILSDGDYQIQGRVRDVVGNYTILGAYQSPIGTEKVIQLAFTISTGQIYIPAKNTGKIFRVYKGGYMIPAGYPGRISATVLQPTQFGQAQLGITVHGGRITSGTEANITNLDPTTSSTTPNETQRLFGARTTSGFTRRRYS